MTKAAIIIERADVSLGGAERSVQELAARLNALGVQTAVLAATGTPDNPNATVLCGENRAKRTSFDTFRQALQSHLTRNRYDIIHSALPFDFADVYQPRGGSYAEAVARNAASYDNPAVRLYKSATSRLNLRRTVLLNAETRLCRPQQRTIVAALSDYVKSQFIRHYRLPEDRIRVIPNAVDVRQPPDPAQVDALRTRILSQMNASPADQPAIFLFAANNFRLKGLAPIIRALAILKNRREPRPACVAVAGSDNPHAYRSLAADLRVANRLLFMGPLPEIHTALAAADAAVLPTFYDPCSRFVLEALARAIPPITTRFNGAAERYTDRRHGIIIDDPRDTRALADAFAWLADADNRLAAAEAIRRDNLEQNISIASHAQTMVELYRHIIADRGSRS